MATRLYPRGASQSNRSHPLKVYMYVFVSRKIDRAKKHPLLVLPHGGVHADFTTYHAHIVREMMEQGYVVLAPEYRGSTGYGKALRNAIDYGGLEVDDCVAARDWAVANLAFVDAKRTGIVGWSHGGLIALMAVFDHPDKFQVAYAGVPVSDLVARGPRRRASSARAVRHSETRRAPEGRCAAGARKKAAQKVAKKRQGALPLGRTP